jgi:hypothetical protein
MNGKQPGKGRMTCGSIDIHQGECVHDRLAVCLIYCWTSCSPKVEYFFVVTSAK